MMSALPPRSGESPRRGTSRLEMMQVGANLIFSIVHCDSNICVIAIFSTDLDLEIYFLQTIVTKSRPPDVFH